MNLSEEIIKILDYIGEKFGLVIDWTTDNITPYFTELCGKIINYEIYTSIIWIVVFCLIIMLSIIYICKSYRWLQHNGDWLYFIIILGVIIIFCVVGFLVQIFDIVKCNVFPEKYLMEYFTNLLRSNINNA